MTTPDYWDLAARWRARCEALEAELAQSQAEVARLKGQLKHGDALIDVLRRDRDGFGAVANAERALADELATALTSPKSSGGEALIRYYRARSGAQGEEGDGE